jgi:hypothetical protein
MKARHFLLPLLTLSLPLLGAGAAYAQADNADAKSDAEIIESYAKILFKADIDAGRLTVPNASALFKCANDRYAQKLTPELTHALSEATRAMMAQNTKVSEADKQRYARTYKEAGKLQQEAEDACRAELGIDPAVQRVFQGFGTKRK